MIVKIKLLIKADPSSDRKLNLRGSNTQVKEVWKLERTARQRDFVKSETWLILHPAGRRKQYSHLSQNQPEHERWWNLQVRLPHQNPVSSSENYGLEGFFIIWYADCSTFLIHFWFCSMLALSHLKKKALILEKSQLLSQYSQDLKLYFVKLSVLDYLYWLFSLRCFIWGKRGTMGF